MKNFLAFLFALVASSVFAAEFDIPYNQRRANGTNEAKLLTPTASGMIMTNASKEMIGSTLQNAINLLMGASGSLAQGDVFYFNGTNVVKLAAGTNGHFLKTQGTGANPVWAAGGAATWGSITGTLSDQIDLSAALAAKATAAALTAHVDNMANPHGVTKTQVGLGNVNNTSDADKPISTATQTALDLKVDEGAITSSGLTMATARILGRTTAGTGAIEELTVVPLTLGGTGQASAQAAINALMAASGALVQGDVFYFDGTNVVRLAAGTNGHFLKTQGAAANPVWAAVSAAPGGSDTQVQFNDGGSFGGDAGMTYEKTGNVLTILGAIELGAADTTISRPGPGTIAVEGEVVFDGDTQPNILQIPYVGVDAGSDDDYVISLAPTLAAYEVGTFFVFKANTANTAGATLNIDGLGTTAIKKQAGGITTALSTNDIRAGQWVTVVFDGTNFQMQSMLGNAPAGSGDVVAVGTLTNNSLIIGQGATSVAAATTGTGVLTALGNNVNSAGGVLTHGGGVYAASGAITSSGLTMTTARLLGRTTASTGAVEELTVGGGLTAATGSLAATDAVRSGGVGFSVSGDAAATGQVQGFVRCKYAGTISSWSITVDAGTCTVKVWKIATGTAKPTISDVINTSGVAISSGTHVMSTTVSDFTTTTVSANDIFGFDITAESGCSIISFDLGITKP